MDFEPLSRILGRLSRRPAPFDAARAWTAERRAAGDETTVRRAEERIQDQQKRLTRYGRAMMVGGAVIVGLSVLLR